MTRRTAGGVLALAFATTAGSAAVIAAQESDRLCGLCQTTGKLAFEIPKPVVDQEKGARYCSEVVADPLLNYGLDYRPCEKCNAPAVQAPVQKKYAEDRAARDQWLKERREIDSFLADPKGLKLMHCATEHFELAWSIPKVKIGRVVWEQHQAMHLYANRLEEAYKLYLDTFGFDHVADENAVRHVFMCFESAKHAQKAQPRYTGMGGTGVTSGVKLVGIKSFFVCWWDKKVNREDLDFHENLVHNAMHMFLASYYNCYWFARKNGWIDEGLSHYFTDKLFQQSRTHCFQEQDEASQWVTTPWRPEIKKRVAAGKLPAFAEVIVKHGENLTADEHMMSWSWVQYLLDEFGRDKFVQLLRGLKEQQPLRDVLQGVYGVSPFQFIDAWKKYVLDTYPSR